MRKAKKGILVEPRAPIDLERENSKANKGTQEIDADDGFGEREIAIRKPKKEEGLSSKQPVLRTTPQVGKLFSTIKANPRKTQMK